MLRYQCLYRANFVRKKLIKMNKLIVTIFSICSAFIYAQQDTITVSQNELVNQIQQNLQLEIVDKDIALAKTNLLKARAMYLPNINISYTGIYTNNPLMAFGSKLNQAVVKQSDFNPILLNKPDEIFNFTTKVDVQQPIYNRDGVWQKRAGKTQVKAMELKYERTKEHMELEIKKAYMQLQLVHKAVEVLEKAKKTTLANKAVVDNYFKNGMIQKSEVLYVDVRLNEIESQLNEAKSNVQNVSDFIAFLLNKDFVGTILLPEKELEYSADLIETNATLNMKRADFQAQETAIMAYEQMENSAKAKFLPRLNAFGSFELHDEKPFGFGANGYLVGIQASWNVFDGKKADSEQQRYKAEREKTEAELIQNKKQGQLELNKALRSVKDAGDKVSLAKLAWEQTKEAYRIKENRFQQGLEKTSDLLVAETKMSQKELEYHQAIFEYNNTVEYYKFLKK